MNVNKLNNNYIMIFQIKLYDIIAKADPTNFEAR